MRNVLALLFCLAAFPALAESLAAQKAEIVKSSRQQTVALGDNRFLMFNGSFAAYQYVYGVELIHINNGVPYYEPLFMEDYDPSSRTISIDGGAFPAISYHFDKASNTLDYMAKDGPNSRPKEYKYNLKGDTLVLREILAQDEGAPPRIVYEAPESHAQTH